MEYKNTILIAAILTVFSILLFTGTTIITTEVIGVNTSTTTTRVWVWNTEPNIYEMIVSPLSIDLTAGNETVVNCTGYVWDYNGWQDINVTNATFYNTRVSSNYGTDDKNYHYSNKSKHLLTSTEDYQICLIVMLN